MPKAVVLFGELLLRLNPEGFGRLVQADRLHVHYTGGEANAGVSLVNWGHEVRMVSRVPAHELGQACVNHLRRFGLDTRHIQRKGERLGLLFVESGASQRQSNVIYDRKDSAFTTFDDEGLDWSEVFRGARWFHFAGTALAAAERIGPILERACATAKKRGLTVSCDLNYRRKLWTPAQAERSISRALANVDLFVCGVDDAKTLFDLRVSKSSRAAQSRAAALDVARQLAKRFSLTHVLVPMRESHSATHNRISALLYTAGANPAGVFSRDYDIDPIVDRVGGGDALTAGVIHGVNEGWEPRRTIEFAVAASCLKHTIPGDFNHVSLEDVNALADGKAPKRIQR